MSNASPIPDVQFLVYADLNTGRWNWRVSVYKPGYPHRRIVGEGFAMQSTNAFIAAQTAFLKWQGRGK